MSKHAKIERSQKLFLAAMKKKFSEDSTKLVTPISRAALKLSAQTDPIQSPRDHVTLLPERKCKPDRFDEEADAKFDKMINAVDDWELRGYRRK